MKRRKRDSVTVERLRELLEYNPETGTLTWLQNHGRNVEGGVVFNLASRRAKDGKRAKCMVVNIDHNTINAPAMCWAMYNGYWPNARVYNVNGNKEDTRIENLCAGAPSQQHGQEDVGFFKKVHKSWAERRTQDHRYPTWLKNYLRYVPEDGTLWWIKDPERENGTGFTGTVFDRFAKVGKYIKGWANGEYVHINHLCVFLHTGKWPEGEVTHANGSNLDFRADNLVVEETTKLRDKPWGSKWRRG